MKITKLITRNVVCINMDDPLNKAKRLFEERGFHHLLVLERGRLVGVISDRDLLKAVSPRVDTLAATSHDLASLNKRAHQIMTRDPISLNEDSTVKAAVDIFNGHKISVIPIIDEDHKPVGILSWRDIMKALGRHLAQES